MDLVNKTPIPAELRVGAPGGGDARAGALLAKATFQVVRAPTGDKRETHALELETQEPLPLCFEDEETDLGLRPRDDLVHNREVFEVILLGAAYTQGETPATATMVTMQVGEVKHELLVVGNRRWENSGLGGATMTEPEPFDRMPMTWEHAFGGTAAVEIDEGSFVEVADSRNRAGKGFDAEAAAEGLGSTFQAPEGYPVLDHQRSLPNLEDPDNRIQNADDSPDPFCWATVPMDSGLHALRVTDDLSEEEISGRRLAEEDALHYRAHPDWVIPIPSKPELVTLQNVTPKGLLSFRIPSLSVVFDYINNGHTATRPLKPHLVVLEPEEMRLTITYRKPFTFTYQEGTERCLRLRTEEEWYAPDH